MMWDHWSASTPSALHLRPGPIQEFYVVVIRIRDLNPSVDNLRAGIDLCCSRSEAGQNRLIVEQVARSHEEDPLSSNQLASFVEGVVYPAVRLTDPAHNLLIH